MSEEKWRSAKDNPPTIGAYVEITRMSPIQFLNTVTDEVYWYPDNGNWPVADMLWRPAKEPEKRAV